MLSTRPWWAYSAVPISCLLVIFYPAGIPLRWARVERDARMIIRTLPISPILCSLPASGWRCSLPGERADNLGTLVERGWPSFTDVMLSPALQYLLYCVDRQTSAAVGSQFLCQCDESLE